MMSASEPQSSQTYEHTTSELMKMIEDLQRTVADLAFGVLAPSSTTSRTREFMSKGSPTLGRVALEEGHSLGKVEASGKNKVGASIGPHEHLQWDIEASKAEGLNKQQVVAVVAKTMDDTFATQNESNSNRGQAGRRAIVPRMFLSALNPRSEEISKPSQRLPIPLLVIQQNSTNLKTPTLSPEGVRTTVHVSISGLEGSD